MIATLFKHKFNIVFGCLLFLAVVTLWFIQKHIEPYPVISDIEKSGALTAIMITGGLILFVSLPVLIANFDARRVLLGVALLYAIPLLAWTCYRWGNMYLDVGAGDSVLVKVVSKRETISYRARKKYYLQFIMADTFKAQEFEVNNKFFHSIGVGEEVALKVNEGFFKKKWISNYAQVIRK